VQQFKVHGLRPNGENWIRVKIVGYAEKPLSYTFAVDGQDLVASKNGEQILSASLVQTEHTGEK
jgi:hypothetical protein